MSSQSSTAGTFRESGHSNDRNLAALIASV
jgi:hypothetical protein